MSKGKATAKVEGQAKSDSLMVKETSVDPSLASLFASSSGPITAPVRILKRQTQSTKTITNNSSTKAISNKKIEIQSQDHTEDTSSSGDLTEEHTDTEEEEEQDKPESRPRKRRRLEQDDDLETSYLNRLAREEQKENSRQKRLSGDTKQTGDGEEDSDDTASSASNDLEDLSDAEDEDVIPQHESLSKTPADYDKTRRTVFLGNVSTNAIRSKSSRKELEAHLRSVLDTEANETIESIRFRSTAYNVTAGPKKAAYAKKDLMEETTKCTNAYVVFSTEAAAKKVAKKLNGTTVLDRHLHTDWLAHPAAIDHKRCVFVGNLNFVDLESNNDTNDDGEKEKRRPKAKEPADAEEGLWRAFSKCGTIESVRVVRDQVTRVGKGFAYVQFSDEVGAEKALALDGKKFPPMLPRLLRVSRAKRVLKKDLKRKQDEQDTPRANKRAVVVGKSRRPGPPALRKKKLDGVVFEGYRASSDRGMKFKAKGKKKVGIKPTSRSSKRGAAFKAGGGKKKRDTK